MHVATHHRARGTQVLILNGESFGTNALHLPLEVVPLVKQWEQRPAQWDRGGRAIHTCFSYFTAAVCPSIGMVSSFHSPTPPTPPPLLPLHSLKAGYIGWVRSTRVSERLRLEELRRHSIDANQSIRPDLTLFIHSDSDFPSHALHEGLEMKCPLKWYILGNENG